MWSTGLFERRLSTWTPVGCRVKTSEPLVNWPLPLLDQSVSPGLSLTLASHSAPKPRMAGRRHYGEVMSYWRFVQCVFTSHRRNCKWNTFESASRFPRLLLKILSHVCGSRKAQLLMKNKLSFAVREREKKLNMWISLEILIPRFSGGEGWFVPRWADLGWKPYVFPPHPPSQALLKLSLRGKRLRNGKVIKWLMRRKVQTTKIN